MNASSDTIRRSAPALRKQPGAWPTPLEGADMANATCSIDGCTKPAGKARGWCEMHYRRWRRHRDPHHAKRIVGDDERRFWSKVDVGDCWEWLGGRGNHGHGYLRIARATTMAHRYAWELLVGPIPDGLELDHLCRNPPCVNPDHLEPVTHRENLLRGAGVASQHAARTHCPQGHPYTLENTYDWSNGNRQRRQCKTCHRERNRR